MCPALAQMAELVDALVSGTSGESRGGSSPLLGTKAQFAAVRRRPRLNELARMMGLSPSRLQKLESGPCRSLQTRARSDWISPRLVRASEVSYLGDGVNVA